MRRNNHVCFDHRIASRGPNTTSFTELGSIHCPVDGQTMTFIGDRRRVPKKGDDRGWAELKRWVRDRGRQRAEWAYRSNPWQAKTAQRLLDRWTRRIP